MQAAPPAKKGEILAALKTASTLRVGSVLSDIVEDDVQARAQLEAEDLLSDDTLTMADLDRVFGD